MHAVLPAAISAFQPDAAALAEAHFAASATAWAQHALGLQRAEAAGGEPGAALLEAVSGMVEAGNSSLADQHSRDQQGKVAVDIEGLHREGLAGPSASKAAPAPAAPPAGSMPECEASPQALHVERAAGAVSWLPLPLRAWQAFSKATGLKLHHLQLGLQVGVCVRACVCGWVHVRARVWGGAFECLNRGWAAGIAMARQHRAGTVKEGGEERNCVPFILLS